MTSKLTHSPQDHLTNTLCYCKICLNLNEKPNPQITIDEEYEKLKSQKSQYPQINSLNLDYQNRQNHIQNFSWYLKKLAYSSKTLPNFPILDTMVMDKQQLAFYIFYENNKPKLHLNSSLSQTKSKCHSTETLQYSLNMIKQKLLDKKTLSDIQYQKSQYKQLNPHFQWAQLDHDAQKLIKQFEKKVKYMDQMLNRVAMIKGKQPTNESQTLMKRNESKMSIRSSVNLSKNFTQQKILSKYEFVNLFDRTRVRVCELNQIDYIQLFPIMYGEEERSRIRQIKYFRDTEQKKDLFKEAQNYVLSWMQKNQTLEKMEEHFMKTYFYCKQNLYVPSSHPKTEKLRLNSKTQLQYLTYITYKLLLHLQAQASLKICQCLVQFISPDDGATFFLKQINYIKYQQKASVQLRQNQLPKYKRINQEDYIHDLKKEMRQMFENVQENFQRLNNDWENMENKIINDMKQSDQVFQTGKNLKMQSQKKSQKPSQFQLKLGSHMLKFTDSLSRFQTLKPPQFNFTQRQNADNNKKVPTLHQILKSNNYKYKQQMLGLRSERKSSPLKQSRLIGKFK